MTARQIRDDLIAESNAGRDRFVRTMILEMYRLSGQMHALAELMTNYIGGDAGSETDEHRAPAVKITPRSARPPASSSAMAMDVSVVGAAPAGNAERPPQPIPNSDSAPPPRAVPAGPPAVESPPAAPPEDKPLVEPALPMKEQVVRLWSTTDLTREEIAAQVGCKLGSVDAFLSQARAKGDRRGFARATMTQTFGAVPERDAGEREAPVSGLSKSPAPKPFDRPPSEPLNPRPGRFAGVIITSPGDVVSIDLTNFVIVCPGGDWQTSRPIALVMERMRNGDTFDHKTLADIGSMGLETFKSSMPRWTEQLAARGVEFISTKGVGCKIRLAEPA